jgi:hypothetical protein
VVQNHPHRTGPDFRREFVRRLACHGSTFSRVGASGNPGAVQPTQSGEFHDAVNHCSKNGHFYSSSEDIAFRAPQLGCNSKGIHF